jgi:4-hydroxy-2-oxoheptanedioate aldolase
MKRSNHLRELLKAGKPSLGTRLHSSWPTIIELVGYSSMFDYVEILAEYAPYNLFSLENQGRAIDLFENFTGMIKIAQESRRELAVKAMNAGIQNVLFADVRTVADVEECIKTVRAESPQTGGLRGVGQGRDVGILLEVGSPAYVQMTADAVVGLMIEKREAIEHLDALLAVKGVDMVQFGPADYAMSLGIAGDRDHSAIREAEKYMIETALRRGVAPRVELNHPRDAEGYLAMGVRHFCMGTDVRTLFNWYKEYGSLAREIISA